MIMIPVYIIFISFMGLFICPSHSQETAEISKLEKFYYDKCLKNSGRTEPFEKLQTDVYEMYKYFQYTIEYLPEHKSQFCGDQRKNLLYRANEIKADLKVCLPTNEKFLAGLLKESFEEFLHFLCHNDGTYTTQFFSSPTQQCKQVIENSKSNDLENCLNRIFAPAKSYITQGEICDDLTVTRKCFGQLLEQYCPTSFETKKLNQKFFDYVSKPCSACSSTVSLAALALFVINLLVR